MEATAVVQVLARIDSWLDTMRGTDGYGGPVAHWWQNCLQFTGAGLDWRYEGLITGYLTLHERTGQSEWLAKARRAGDDLLSGQLPGGTYRNSSFELNPYSGGTPHEAAADLALLHLAEALRERGDHGPAAAGRTPSTAASPAAVPSGRDGRRVPSWRDGVPIRQPTGRSTSWRTYLQAAEANLRGYYVGTLWDEQAQSFRDHPRFPSFVPNKSATLVEALLKLAALSGDEEWAERYARPTLQAVLAHQVSGGDLDGAIEQASQNGRRAGRYFPYYNARCVPGLVAGYEWSRDERLLDAARRAMAFVLRWRYEDGSFPQVVYAGGRVNRYPQWIAAVGDILRALDLLRPYGLDADFEPTRRWLLQGQMPTGAFRTAHGFGSQISQRPPGVLPEFRDLLPVCGWVDKAFRWMAEDVKRETGNVKREAEDVKRETGNVTREAENGKREAGNGRREAEGAQNAKREAGNVEGEYEAECTLRGERVLYREDAAVIELRSSGQAMYRWQKGQPWAEVCAEELLWK